jgi:hypothetical protein
LLNELVVKPTIPVAGIAFGRAGHDPSLVSGRDSHRGIAIAQQNDVGVLFQKDKIFSEVAGRFFHSLEPGAANEKDTITKANKTEREGFIADANVS